MTQIRVREKTVAYLDIFGRGFGRLILKAYGLAPNPQSKFKPLIRYILWFMLKASTIFALSPKELEDVLNELEASRASQWSHGEFDERAGRVLNVDHGNPGPRSDMDRVGPPWALSSKVLLKYSR
jgi:hypothetical protein